MLYGYTRFPPHGTAGAIDAEAAWLLTVGCAEVFADAESAHREGPGWVRLLDVVAPNDLVVVAALNRLPQQRAQSPVALLDTAGASVVTWDYYIHLMDLQHTAPTAAEREAARREKLQLDIAASKRMHAQAPGPPCP